MKNKLILTLALGLAGASSLMATEVHVYLTGSTAFRQNAYNAAINLFSPAPTIYYGDAAHGGANSGFSSSTASWVMVGTPIAGITAISSGTQLAVHGLFTGSIQGVKAVETQQGLPFADDTSGGTSGGLVTGYVTNAPTIAFDDVSASITPYAASGNYKEENVAVIPFGFFKAVSGGAGANILTNVTGVSWEQAEYGVPAGRIPLSAWTYKSTDTNTFIYLLERTQDSGTRRSELADLYFPFNKTIGIYLYDKTNDVWFTPTVLNSTANATPVATPPYGVVNGGTFNAANYDWGFGYVGGGDIKTALGYSGANDTAIGYLSFADGQSVVSGNNWSQLLPFNGIWPTAAGAGIHGQLSSATNDFSPITKGYYPLWGQVVIVFPKDATLQAGQTIGAALGDQNQPGTFLGVFDAQTLINGGSPIPGSIENEIYLSETVPAKYPNTAIRLSEMQVKRPSPGGTISPF